ncbi:TonB-dependent siderophore receptor [Xylophilus sp. Leaf220]|uniref:TonB-dependent siderophore receptor n=1 Tax=Xylophilus sp. Leaf220 TaxID=1735686 RepID=UPI0009E6F3DD|nr:TonB-dependent receptor [Xylophilus sp. Leaf220]
MPFFPARFRRAPLAAAIALLGVPPVLAQDAPAAGAATASAATAATAGTLGDVTVSSERLGSFGSGTVQVGTFRDQNPLDVPLTNNVITREVIDAQGQRTLYGALRNTAGVTRSQLSGSAYDNIAIRGILVENRGNYRLNGSLPIVNLIDVPLENKERVEVLKGASSLYYGFVPPSGIVNFVTKRAGAQPVTSFATSVNQYGAADVHADIGRRFGEGDAMGLRINAVTGREDSGIRNFSGDRQLLSGAFDWKVSSRLNLRLDAEYYRKDVSEQAGITLPAAVAGRITLPRLPDNRTNLAGEWQRYKADAANLLARADFALTDDWSAIVELGRARNHRDRRFSQFGLANPVTGAGTLTVSQQDGQSYQNDNLRTELAGRVATGPVAHEITVGFTRNERAQDSRNSPTLSFPQNLYTPVDIPFVPRTAANASTPSAIVDRGLYLFDRIALSEQWQVMAGLRRSDYSSTTPTTRYEAQKTSPTVSLMWKPTARTSVYASYIQGLEESGTAPATRANAGELLPPSVNKQIEFGAKAEVAQGVLLQAAYFDVKRPSTTVDAANRFVLGGESRYKGLEFAASGEITRQFALVASALAMDPKIVRTAVAAELGRIPENAPRTTWSLFGEYRPDALPGLAFNAGYYYTGKRPVNNANQAFIDGVGLVSLGARWRTRLAGRQTTLQVNVDNAADKNYWNSTGNGLLGVGAPRTVRLAAKVDF